MACDENNFIMNPIIQKAISHPVISLGTAILWGLLEFMALQRLRRDSRRKRKPAKEHAH